LVVKDMQYEIITFGNGEILKGIFDALAICLNAHSGTLYLPLIKISMIIGALWVALYALYGDYLRAINQWIIPMTAIMQLLLVPQATIWIIDPVSRYQQKVDHVPYGLAMIAGNISKIGYEITKQIEKVFVLPDEFKYQTSGALFAANLIQQAKSFRITNENLAENMRQFVEQCIVYDALIGKKYTIEELRHSDDLWGLVAKEPSPSRSFLWRELTPGTRPYIITCQTGVNKFNQEWGQAITTTATVFGKKIFGENADINPKAELFKFLPLAYSTLTNIAKSAEDLLKQQMMIYALVDGIEQKSTSLGNQPNFALRRAYLGQRTSYATLGALAADTLPVIKGVLEAIGYAAFLFIMPLSILPFGWSFIKNWVQTLLWLQMWAPLYAILNYMLTLAAKAKAIMALQVSNQAGVTIASSIGLVNVNADVAAMAGYLALTIPFLCLAIVKGAGALVNVAAMLTGISQSAGSQAAGEAISGNYSFGNITQGTQQIANTNMLNQSYAASLRSGSFQQSDGRTELITSTDGQQLLNISSSNLPLSLNVAATQSADLRKQAHRSYQQAINHTESFATSMAESLRQGVELAEHLANSKQNVDAFNDSKTIEQTKAINKSAQIIKDFAKENDLTTTQAAQVLAAASCGTNPMLATVGLINVGAKLAGNISGSASLHDIYKKAEKIANSQELQHGLRQAMQLSHNQTFSQHNDQGKRLFDNIARSWDEANSFREEANKSFNEAKSYSQQASIVTSTAAAINANYTQEFVDWLALQAADNTNGHIGKRGAAFIIANNPGLRLEYAQQFLAAKNLLPQAASELEKLTPDNLRAAYEQEQQHAFSKVNKDNAINKINTFRQQALQQLVAVDDYDLANKFNTQQTQVEQQLAAKEQHITAEYNKSVARHEAKSKKNLAGQALQQGAKQVLDLITDPIVSITVPSYYKDLIEQAIAGAEQDK